jgi:hypothetical protein
LGLVALLGATTMGCSTSVRWGSVTVLRANQARELGGSGRFRYVATGLTASDHASVEDPTSADLATRVMDALVAKAHLGPNQALSDVTLEDGVIEQDGRPATRVVTLRADVVEFLPEAGR